MDSRTAAHALSRIAAFLELAGQNRYKVSAYRNAARNVAALGATDLRPLIRSGELAKVRGVGAATLSVITELAETGESRYLEELRAQVPEGLLELMRVPGLSAEKIHQLHAELGIASLDDLERAATSGELKKVKGIGPKTAAKLLDGIAFVRNAGTAKILPHAIPDGNGMLAAVRSHPDVLRAELAGAIRRSVEIVPHVDIVAACSTSPASVAQSFTRLDGVSRASGDEAEVSIHFVDGTRLDLVCVEPDDFAMAWWRATGSAEHVSAVDERLGGKALRPQGEAEIYAAAGMTFLPPELREGRSEIERASRGPLPTLIQATDIRGVLHCHSNWSDGVATIAEMAEAAQARGWSYLGITDHSEAAFFANGVSRDRMLEQHDEIDALNASLRGFRVLKGVEADILADGRLDYDAALLARFDFVIGSIHSRFKMDRDAMTERVLRAMDDPHMTILAHPTGRLLLSREPYGLDLDAVFAKAAAVGVAIELNADPKRLDIDWRYLDRARELGVTIEIGPDAHSRAGLQWTDLGVMMARKGWIEPRHVLNTRSADDVLAFARKRRA
jgi:DNA polymerase (family 10)